jgi:hypothetical protein
MAIVAVQVLFSILDVKVSHSFVMKAVPSVTIIRKSTAPGFTLETASPCQTC